MSERRMARRYWHRVASFRPCWRSTRRPCVRCWVREVLGINRREREAFLERSKKIRAEMERPRPEGEER